MKVCEQDCLEEGTFNGVTFLNENLSPIIQWLYHCNTLAASLCLTTFMWLSVRLLVVRQCEPTVCSSVCVPRVWPCQALKDANVNLVAGFSSLMSRPLLEHHHCTKKSLYIIGGLPPPTLARSPSLFWRGRVIADILAGKWWWPFQAWSSSHHKAYTDQHPHCASNKDFFRG